MSRVAWFESPLLVGFDGLRVAAERANSAAESYPPYNVEAVGPHHIRITIAVAGFAEHELSVTEDTAHLIVEGQKEDAGEKRYVHRGIATRRFRRVFVLADGFTAVGATLSHGLLTIDAERPEPMSTARRIPIALVNDTGEAV